MDADEIKKLQEDRLRYLESAYHQSKGDPSAYIPWEETGTELGFDKDRTISIMEWLKNEGLIDFQTTSSFNITNLGIGTIEDSISKPDEAIGPLVAYNTINIEKMENSQIQQGTINSEQTVTIIQQNDLTQINELLKNIESTISKVDINTDTKKDLESDIETIKAQIKSSKPKKNIVLEAFKSIKNILASISVIVSSHPELIEAITEILTHLGGA